jgi:AraC-like DNA-binding protein
MDLAGDLMMEHESVKIVANVLGFRRPDHFCRAFKRHYGMTATEYLLKMGVWGGDSSPGGTAGALLPGMQSQARMAGARAQAFA